MPQPLRHIAVEGAIGAGKSTLAGKLAVHWHSELLLEKPEDNPFLARFYADPARYALQTQLCFLFQRVEQVRSLAQPGIFSAGIVSDFMFDKDMLFAGLTLSDDEFALYRQVHAQMAPRLPQPDLVIWLQARPETLLQRIRQRGIGMEQRIDAAYLQRLHDAYAERFGRDPGLPLLVVDADAFNPLARPADFERLLQRIERFHGPRESFPGL
jgi:deoxyadenosine/deoxycytidine kinase